MYREKNWVNTIDKNTQSKNEKNYKGEGEKIYIQLIQIHKRKYEKRWRKRQRENERKRGSDGNIYSRYKPHEVKYKKKSKRKEAVRERENIQLIQTHKGKLL